VLCAGRRCVGRVVRWGEVGGEAVGCRHEARYEAIEMLKVYVGESGVVVCEDGSRPAKYGTAAMPTKNLVGVEPTATRHCRVNVEGCSGGSDQVGETTQCKV